MTHLLTDKCRSEALLAALASADLLTPQQAGNVRAECRRGATLTSALALMADESSIWDFLASRAGKPFLRTHQEMRVFSPHLLDHHAALKHQILPWKKRGRALQVLTYNPERVDGLVENLGGRMLFHTVTSPTVWRYLYDIAYPSCITGPLDEAQACALVTSTPLEEPANTTPEQRAEILAMTRGYHYIDLRRDPIDDQVRTMLTLPVKVLCRAYPHHLEGQRLVVMMVDPDDQQGLQKMKQQTQRELVPTVTTQDVIDQLIAEDERSGDWSGEA